MPLKVLGSSLFNTETAGLVPTVTDSTGVVPATSDRFGLAVASKVTAGRRRDSHGRLTARGLRQRQRKRTAGIQLMFPNASTLNVNGDPVELVGAVALKLMVSCWPAPGSLCALLGVRAVMTFPARETVHPLNVCGTLTVGVPDAVNCDGTVRTTHAIGSLPFAVVAVVRNCQIERRVGRRSHRRRTD